MSPAPLGEGLFAEVVEALLTFEKAPGRYAVAMRKPQVVFEHLRTVLQLAVGRAAESAALPAGKVVMAQGAARFFVRTVMLRPGSDHYTLLGLPHRFEPDDLRDHYRMMIRLTHPDFIASGELWPADAATRINIANDVLSSSVKRAEYERRFIAAAPAARTPRRSPGRGALASAIQVRARQIALGGVAVFAGLGALLLLRPDQDDGSLTVAAARSAPEQAASTLASTLASDTPAGQTLVSPFPPGTPSVPLASAPLEREPAALLRAPDAESQPEPAPVAAPPHATSRPGRLNPREAHTVALERAPAASPTAVAAASAQPTAPLLPAAPSAAPQVALPAPASPPPEAGSAPVVATAPAPEPSAASGLQLIDVQPVLTRLVESLASGNGPAVVRWVDPALRGTAANQRFINSFHFSLNGRRVVQLERADFSARDEAGQLIVNGNIDLLLEEPQGGTASKKLLLKALFSPRDGRAVLTQLVNVPVRQSP